MVKGSRTESIVGQVLLISCVIAVLLAPSASAAQVGATRDVDAGPTGLECRSGMGIINGHLVYLTECCTVVDGNWVDCRIVECRDLFGGLGCAAISDTGNNTGSIVLEVTVTGPVRLAGVDGVHPQGTVNRALAGTADEEVFVWAGPASLDVGVQRADGPLA